MFPDVWKTTEIVPICKSGDKQDISNFRGISLLFCTSKVLEKLLFEKIYAVTDVRPNDCVYNLTMDNKLNQAFKTDHLPYSIQLIMSVTQSSYYRSSVKRTKRDFSVVSLDKGDGRKHYRMSFSTVLF